MRSLRSRLVAVGIGLVSLSTLATAHAGEVFTRGPYPQDLGSRSVAILFGLSEPHGASVELVRAGSPSPSGSTSGASAAAPPSTEAKATSAASATVESRHELVVHGLTPATTYRYTVKLDDGRTSDGTFTTAPEDDRAIDFVVYGDTRDGAAVHATMVDRIRATPSSFLVQTGDMVANGSDPGDWAGFFTIERELLRDRCLFPVIGNHEIASPMADGARRFADFFRLPSPPGSSERYYTFRWGNVRFFMLDAQNDFVGDERDWLDKALTEADGEAGVRWRFVVLHHGPYSSGLHGPNRAMNAAQIPALLTQHKVDLVIAGHDHIYERGLGERGLRYVISGGGGAPL
ncbi:MAG: metallophosphoesterase, partial [Polyangiales bacterium]